MKRKGFTLVEMLVVIGIILLLIGLLSPMTMRAWRAGDRAKTTATLSAIAAGLEAYRTDHGDYPRVDTLPYVGATDRGYNGARMLCRALVGPGPGVGPASSIPDGAGGKKTPSDPTETEPAPGFRVRSTQGRVYGPYLNAATLKLGDPASSTPPGTTIGLWAILDHYGSPILYYPATGKVNVRQGTAPFIGDYDPATPPADRPLYNARDNVKAMPLAMFAKMMGDANADKKISGAEVPAYEGPFLLWSSGPDNNFGSPTTLENCDDVTNFRN